MRATRRSIAVRRDRGRQRGAALVEAAIVFPVLMTLVFGMLEFALVFMNASTVAGATRSGVRAGSASPRVAGYEQGVLTAVTTALKSRSSATPQEVWIYKADPASGLPLGGNLSSPSGCPANSCGRWVWSGSAWTQASATMWAPSSQSACLAPASSTYPDSLGVYVKVQHSLITRLFGSSFTLSDKSVMRLEPIPSSSGCS
jgi:hypothetical protein